MNSQNLIPIIGATVSIVSAIIASLFGWLSIRNAKLSQHAFAEKEAADAYERMISFRVKHPYVLRLSRQWEQGNFNKVHLQKSLQDDEKWVVYYSYFELCISFCNIVLAAWYQGRMDNNSFEKHYEPLIKLVLTEHNPIIEDIVNPKAKYVSYYIQKFRTQMDNNNWDWKENHEMLVK